MRSFYRKKEPKRKQSSQETGISEKKERGFKSMWKKWKSLNLSLQIIICVIIGLICGIVFGEKMEPLGIIGKMFIKAVQMMVIVIIGPAMVSGFTSVDNPKQIGKTGSKIIGIFAVMYLIAAVLALVLVNVLKPGVGMEIVIPDGYTYTPNSQGFVDMIANIVPKNPVMAFAEGNLLQILFVVLLFASACIALKDKVPTLIKVANEWNEVAMHMLTTIMKVSPYCAGFLMASAIGVNGASILGKLFVFVVIIYAGQIILAAINVLWVGAAGLNMREYIRLVTEPAVIAFTTRSSLAALPANIECVTKCGVPRGIGIFGTTLGNTIDMTGTSFFQAVSVIFIAQAYGLEMSLAQQIIVVLTAATVCVSLVGVPGAGMATIGILLTSAGLPAEGLALIIAVDAIVDMPRTMNNVFGDASATIVAAKMDGLIDPESPLLKKR